MKSDTIVIEQPTDPIDMLIHEHRRASQALRKLEDALLSIEQTGFSIAAFEQIAEAIRFIDTTFREHDQKEKRFLFVFLEKHQQGITKEYYHEHCELWSAFSHSLTCVHNVESGRLHGLSLRELLQTAKHIVELLRAHIQKENEVLFPMARKILTDSEYEHLQQNLHRVKNNDLFENA